MEQKKIPPCLVTDNLHGSLQFGPLKLKGKDDNTHFHLCTTSGYNVHALSNGNVATRIPGSSIEICGDDFAGQYGGEITNVPKNNLGKVIYADNGDIHIIANSGNIHLKGRSVFIEAEGPGTEGNINIAANGPITIASNDRVIIGAGSLCLRGQSGIDIATQGLVKVLGEIQETKPFSILSFLDPAAGLTSLIQNLATTCK